MGVLQFLVENEYLIFIGMLLIGVVIGVVAVGVVAAWFFDLELNELDGILMTVAVAFVAFVAFLFMFYGWKDLKQMRPLTSSEIVELKETENNCVINALLESKSPPTIMLVKLARKECINKEWKAILAPQVENNEIQRESESLDEINGRNGPD